MKLKLLSGVTAVAMLAGISSASADIITVTWNGTVSSGTDTAGLFGGGNLANEAFTATYVFDTSTVGAKYSLGSNVQSLQGGNNAPGSGTTVSPLVSGTLQIGNTSVALDGAANSSLGASFGGNNAFGNPTTANFSTFASGGTLNTLELEFQGSTPGPVPGFPIAINQNGSFTHTPGDGVTINQAANDQFFRGGDDLALSPTSVTVVDQTSAVPEPSTWAMMFVGFAGLGFLSYRRARRQGGLQFRLA